MIRSLDYQKHQADVHELLFSEQARFGFMQKKIKFKYQRQS